MELRYSIILILFTYASLSAEVFPGFEAKSIRQFPLDNRTVYDIKIAKDEVTTLTFPGPISALEGAGITSDPKQSPAPVLLSYQEGRSYFSVRSVAESAVASLNVIYKKQTYVLHLSTDKDPYRSITFTTSENDEPRRTPSSPLDPTRILALIDRSKAHHLIEAQHPELVSTLETSAPNSRFLYKNFDVVLAEVFRFDEEDTLVFKILLFNKSEKEIYYQPQSLAVRIGTRVFYSALADASGIMKSGTREPKTKEVQPGVSVAYFAVTGTPDGGRNNLSVKNAFNVLVTRLH